jgi:hypothetical protein
MPGGKSLFFNTMIPSGGNPPLMARGGELLVTWRYLCIILPDSIKQAMALANSRVL